MKFLANEKITLYTSLNESEVLEKFREIVSPRQSPWSTEVREKTFDGMITGSYFNFSKRIFLGRGTVTIEIIGLIQPADNGSSVTIEIKPSTMTYVQILVLVAIAISLFTFSLIAALMGIVSPGNGLYTFWLIAGFVVSVDLILISLVHQETKDSKRFFLEFFEAQETPILD